jgi:hypothetical protein
MRIRWYGPRKEFPQTGIVRGVRLKAGDQASWVGFQQHRELGSERAHHLVGLVSTSNFAQKVQAEIRVFYSERSQLVFYLGALKETP